MIYVPFWGFRITLQLEEPPLYKGSLSSPVNAAIFRPRGRGPRGAIMKAILEPGGYNTRLSWGSLRFTLLWSARLSRLAQSRRSWDNDTCLLSITRNCVLNLKKSLGSIFFWTSRVSVKRFSFSWHVFLTSPHPRVFNRVWFDLVLQHCFITTPRQAEWVYCIMRLGILLSAQLFSLHFFYFYTV